MEKRWTVVKKEVWFFNIILITIQLYDLMTAMTLPDVFQEIKHYREKLKELFKCLYDIKSKYWKLYFKNVIDNIPFPMSLLFYFSDFCEPNQCENGGTCVQSIWPSEPQLTTCRCPPGFDGHYCQYTALEVCELPLSRGNLQAYSLTLCNLPIGVNGWFAQYVYGPCLLMSYMFNILLMILV